MGYWGAFALYPVPGADFDYASVGVPADWPHHASGLAGHWNKNGNLAWAFDRWFLNLFPRASPFTHNRGGYATLSFIPTLGTMLLGLIAGGWLKADAAPRASWGGWRWRAWWGRGWAGAGPVGICPIVKRIWTPSWVLFSGGICFVVLAVLYAGVDVLGSGGGRTRSWSIGRNAIAAYCLAHLIEDFITASIRTHLGQNVFQSVGEPYEPLVEGVGPARGLLADPLLDGPAADLPQGLTRVASGDRVGPRAAQTQVHPRGISARSEIPAPIRNDQGS